MHVLRGPGAPNHPHPTPCLLPSPPPRPARQVAAGGAAPLLDTAEAVLAVRRVPEKLFGMLEMHDAVQAALGPLRAALAAGGSRLERVSMGAEQQGLVARLSQVGG